MPPSNTTPATAIEVLVSAMPYTNTQNVSDAGGNVQTVYYKITNDLTHDVVVTMWFYATIPSNTSLYYQADYGVYKEIALSTTMLDAFPNSPGEIPIKAGASYWIQVFKRGTNTNPTLNVNITVKPYSTYYPAGQIVIFSASTDANFVPLGGLHTTFIDPTLGQIVNFIPFFPSCEQGDILSTGTFLIDDGDSVTTPPPTGSDSYLLLYDKSYSLITRTLFTAGSAFVDKLHIRTNNATNKFWIAQGGFSGTPNRYASVTSVGVLSTITSLLAFVGTTAVIGGHATTNNESHLLIAPKTAGTANYIHKWNLGTLAWDGTIGTEILGWVPTDVLVLADDTIIVSYIDKFATGKSTIIRQYNLAGTQLNTITITTTVRTSADPRLGYAADPLYFWLWIPKQDGQSLLKKFKASDFSLAVDKIIPNVYETQIETATPSLIYSSDSCPVIETRVDGGVIPPTPESPDPAGSGIYFSSIRSNPNTPITDDTVLKHDKYNSESSTPTVVVVKRIPDPTVRTALLGD